MKISYLFSLEMVVSINNASMRSTEPENWFTKRFRACFVVVVIRLDEPLKHIQQFILTVKKHLGRWLAGGRGGIKRPKRLGAAPTCWTLLIDRLLRNNIPADCARHSSLIEQKKQLKGSPSFFLKIWNCGSSWSWRKCRKALPGWWSIHNKCSV